MNKIKRLSISHQKALIKSLGPYSLQTRDYWLKNAKKRIGDMELSEKNKADLYNSFREDYGKYRQTFQEYYYCYKFQLLTEKEKKSFLTMRDLQFVLRKYKLYYPEQWSITGNKIKTIEEFRDFVKRDWMKVDSKTNPEEVQDFINRFDVIVKPIDGESGKGVYKIQKGGTHQIFDGKLPVILEECVSNIEELKEYHPSSLNTIRVVTISNGRQSKIFGAFFRTGNNNSVFDNADAGGVFAEIDVDTGKMVSDGITVMGEEVKTHPASGKSFKGFIIPKWDEVIEFSHKLALHNKNMTIVAWDIAITPKGCELIECNSVPSIYPHQTPLHKGLRKRFYKQMKELGLPYKDALFWGKLLSKICKLFSEY
ncbi:sugar-transfer associated ATP-grasp domain-containing protein [Butyrivibrio sp. TB]|uniref:sugar-transfer associated ATP-grasp domain-containing protein n=1 Tax=Butyrivibrio sp. TB TaxID=1520809 RepID=UPI0008B07512|nr:sugar-transfer associated ATP-grasp domain-containing protein [Butyrivibrio sp. TB]SEP83453.1 Glutathione synthase/RimK-type ligase, ATP-grasp superfamily [Butyrivibrio sp. TB]